MVALLSFRIGDCLSRRPADNVDACRDPQARYGRRETVRVKSPISRFDDRRSGYGTYRGEKGEDHHRTDTSRRAIESSKSPAGRDSEKDGMEMEDEIEDQRQ